MSQASLVQEGAGKGIVRTEVWMGTLVTVHVVPPQGSSNAKNPAVIKDEIAKEIDEAIGRAFAWFDEVESRCTRFDPRSELMQLTAQIGVAVPVTPMLFQAVRFAVMVAEESRGAFDPTVGQRMEARGFHREHRSGQIFRSSTPPNAKCSYRDVKLDEARQTILLRRPLTLDLGAVAKGLAVDLATQELAPFENFAIDAGGDLYLGGLNAQQAPWSIGIRHPRNDREIIDTLRVSNQAICTSGDYARRVRPAPSSEETPQSNTTEHHILDPRTGASPTSVASVTVVAPSAMLADALATAAFVMGPEKGLDLLARMGVEGLILTSDLQRCETRGLPRA